jgi:hypothetical protein
MPSSEVNHIEDMEHAVKYMLRFLRKETRDVRHLYKDAKHEEKHSKQHNEENEFKDVEHIEKDIYKFLYHNIRVMHSLVKIEKDQDFVENQDHFKNPYKTKISREVAILLRELRRIGALDRKTH